MIKKIVYSSLAFAPVLAFAQGVTGIQSTATGIENLARSFTRVTDILIPAFFGLAVIYFFYGVAKYILSAGDPVAAGKGKSIMIYGVIAIAVMASLYGLIAWLQSILGIQNANSVTLPKIDYR